MSNRVDLTQFTITKYVFKDLMLFQVLSAYIVGSVGDVSEVYAHIKEDYTGGASETHGRYEKYVQSFRRKT